MIGRKYYFVSYMIEVEDLDLKKLNKKYTKKLLNSYTSGGRKAYWKNKSRPKHSEYMKENSGF